MNNDGTLIIAPIRPQSSADTFPSAYSNEILGGHHQVADIAARNAIPSERLIAGMFCTTQDTNTVYILNSIGPNVWVEFASGSSFETAIGGFVDLNNVDNVYSIGHAQISGQPLPMATLVSPDANSILYVSAITNITTSGFDVVLSGVPSVSGYQINWTNGVLNTVNISGGISDHGLLNGLGDDDHPQYLLASGSREISGSLTPSTSGTFDLGSITKPFKDLYLTSNSLYLGSDVLSTNASQLTLNGNVVGNTGNVISSVTVQSGESISAGQGVSIDPTDNGTAVEGIKNIVSRTAESNNGNGWVLLREIDYIEDKKMIELNPGTNSSPVGNTSLYYYVGSTLTRSALPSWIDGTLTSLETKSFGFSMSNDKTRIAVSYIRGGANIYLRVGTFNTGTNSLAWGSEINVAPLSISQNSNIQMSVSSIPNTSLGMLSWGDGDATNRTCKAMVFDFTNGTTGTVIATTVSSGASTKVAVGVNTEAISTDRIVASGYDNFNARWFFILYSRSGMSLTLLDSSVGLTITGGSPPGSRGKPRLTSWDSSTLIFSFIEQGIAYRYLVINITGSSLSIGVSQIYFSTTVVFNTNNFRIHKKFDNAASGDVTIPIFYRPASTTFPLITTASFDGTSLTIKSQIDVRSPNAALTEDLSSLEISDNLWVNVFTGGSTLSFFNDVNITASTSYLGIATESKTSGQTLEVLLKGILPSSGLTAVSQYFLDVNGNVVSTVTDFPVGLSVNSSSLYVDMIANYSTITDQIDAVNTKVITNINDIEINSNDISAINSDVAVVSGGVDTNTANISAIQGDYVDLTSAQSISGNKTFTNAVVGVDPTNSQHFATKSYVDSVTGGGGVTDHGLLNGLGDDDHQQYLLASGSREISGSLIPSTSGTFDLGSLAQPFKDLYLTGNSLYLGSNSLSASGSVLYFNDSEVGSGSALGLTYTKIAGVNIAKGKGLSIDPDTGNVIEGLQAVQQQGAITSLTSYPRRLEPISITQFLGTEANGNAVVYQTSGLTLTQNATNNFLTGSTVTTVAPGLHTIVPLSATTVAIVYGSSTRLEYRIGTLSGNVITWGTIYVITIESLGSTTNEKVSDATRVSNTEFVVVYSDSSGHFVGRVCNISGTVSASTTIHASISSRRSAIGALNNDKYIVVYEKSNALYSQRELTITGGVITSTGSPTNLAVSASGTITISTGYNNNIAVITNSTFSRMIGWVYNGDTSSIGAIQTISSSDSQFGYWNSKLNGTTVVTATIKNFGGGNLFERILEIDSINLTLSIISTEEIFVGVSGEDLVLSVASTDQNTILQMSSSPNNYRVKILEGFTKYIGIANQTVTASQEIEVLVRGEFNTTSLVSGSQYFLNSSGDISTAPSSNPIGTASTSGELNVDVLANIEYFNGLTDSVVANLDVHTADTNIHTDLTSLDKSITPDTSGVYDLGSLSLPFKDLYLTSNSLYLGSDKISINNNELALNDIPINSVISSDVAIVSGGVDTNTASIAAIQGDYVDLTSAQSISGNKTFTNVVVGVDPVIGQHFATKSYVDSVTGGGVTDHGLLNGLGDDDHPQYLLASGSREISGSLTPSTSGTFDLGSLAQPFKDLYLTSNSLYLGSDTISSDGTNIFINGGKIPINSTVVHNTGNETIGGVKTFTNGIKASGNIEQNSGWMIVHNGNRLGVGTVPNWSNGQTLQVDGAAGFSSGIEYWDVPNARTSYAQYVVGSGPASASLYTYKVRNYANDFTLLTVNAKSGSVISDDREATLALIRTDDSGNEEYLDLYNNGYPSGVSKISQAYGTRIQKRGNGVYRSYYFDWYDGSSITDGYVINPPTSAGGPSIDYSMEVSASNGLIVGTSMTPNTSGDIDLGSITKPFKDLYLTGNSLYLGDKKLSADSGSLIFNGGEVTSEIPAGDVWESHSSPESNLWRSATYGNGLYVAVSQNGTNRVMTSPDGITWTSRSASEASNWYSITYGNGIFVAVAQIGTNRVMTSPDGITWTSRSASEANTWNSIIYGNGIFVAVSGDGTNRVMTSPDGITWTSRSASEATSWQSVTYGNGIYVAISGGGVNRVMTSPDGITWTTRTASELNNWNSITYGNGIFVVVASSGGVNRVMTSPDGITWTTRSVPESNNWFSVTYGNGLFVAVSQNGINRVMTSPDGIIWTAKSAASTGSWLSVAYGNKLFVALSSGSLEVNQIMTSKPSLGKSNIFSSIDAAIVWKPREPTSLLSWNSVTYGNGLYVAVSSTGTNRVMTSPDGKNWNESSASEANSWISVTYGNGLFVAVSPNGTNRVMTSPDGITWTARSASEANFWVNVTYGNGLFVAVSSTGTNRVMTSPDGITWTARSASEANAWNSVTYGNGLFVAVSSTGTNRVMTSPDGITWIARSASEANSWNSVTYGNRLYVAVASSGNNRIMTSYDGITWIARATSDIDSWKTVIYGNGMYVAVASSGTNRVMTSEKGQEDLASGLYATQTSGQTLTSLVTEIQFENIDHNDNGIWVFDKCIINRNGDYIINITCGASASFQLVLYKNNTIFAAGSSNFGNYSSINTTLRLAKDDIITFRSTVSLSLNPTVSNNYISIKEVK